MKRTLLIACLVFDLIWIHALFEKGISSTTSHIVDRLHLVGQKK